MSDLLTAAVFVGAAILIVVLACIRLIAVERRIARKEAGRQQALVRERELRELEQAPVFRIDPIIDSLPADIRKDFQ